MTRLIRSWATLWAGCWRGVCPLYSSVRRVERSASSQVQRRRLEVFKSARTLHDRRRGGNIGGAIARWAHPVNAGSEQMFGQGSCGGKRLTQPAHPIHHRHHHRGRNLWWETQLAKERSRSTLRAVGDKLVT